MKALTQVRRRVLLLSLCTLCAGTPSALALEIVEEAAEVRELDLRLSSADRGRIVARLCDYCELLSLEVDARTRVLLDGATVSLEVAKQNRARGATVFFDPKTMRVLRIRMR